ncbi:MAG TPA: heterodisulfide reductase-related iron-sulfur binding cluster [bacterium]|nr:heterodisulfide reductase-related iron-sulfur binding cluster [bacterium]HQI49859.1 heterodisulfide reductase-related iron-sulfur binding cluster [bacterium]HQJ65876.1 heterodisulfide reductase-related iron-sulfur binding cluster [bacterium]
MLNWSGRIALVLLILAALAWFLWQIALRIRLVRLGRREPVRWDHPLERLLWMAGRVVVQICAVKDRPLTGVLHALIFWGFLFFTVATINHVGQAFTPGFSILGHNWFADAWFLGVDLAALLTLAGVLGLAVRRYLLRPAGITLPQPISRSPHSAIVLSLIAGLMITYLLNQAAEQLLNGAPPFAWMPVSTRLAPLFAGLSADALGVWNSLLWWSHLLMVLGFLVFIPGSKHLHLLSGPVNLFFRSREPIGTLQPIDFEKSEQFGAATLPHYPWKNISDFFSCIDCGRCQDVCPAFATGKALSPKVVMMSQRKYALTEAQRLLAGVEPSAPILGSALSDAEIWACTTCGACMEVCPVRNEHIPALVDLRRNRVMMESTFPQELQTAFRGLETNGNPWNAGSGSRMEWAEGLNVPVMAAAGEVDYLWFVGCAGAFDERARAVSRSLAAVLNHAGVRYGVLGLEEKCCGDPARRAGNEYLFQTMAMENIQILQQYQFKILLTSCPHGMHLFGEEYARLGARYEVVHHTTLIQQLLTEGRIRLNGESGQSVTWHDSCYLGRYHALYDAPRAVLARLNGAPPVEMAHSRAQSFCCGGGGARMFMEESEGTRINHHRIGEAAENGAAIVASGCPFCLAMLDDGIKEKGWTEKLLARDLAQLVAERLAD